MVLGRLAGIRLPIADIRESAQKRILIPAFGPTGDHAAVQGLQPKQRRKEDQYEDLFR